MFTVLGFSRTILILQLLQKFWHVHCLLFICHYAETDTWIYNFFVKNKSTSVFHISVLVMYWQMMSFVIKHCQSSLQIHSGIWPHGTTAALTMLWSMTDVENTQSDINLLTRAYSWHVIFVEITESLELLITSLGHAPPRTDQLPRYAITWIVGSSFCKILLVLFMYDDSVCKGLQLHVHVYSCLRTLQHWLCYSIN